MATTSAVTTSLSDLPAVESTTTTTSGSNTLDKDAFMKLLIEQLKDQDPTNPVDNSQMIAQLAQFSQLEELQSMSKSIDNMALSTTSANQLNAVNLVGKVALFKADRIGLTAGSSSNFQLSLDQATNDTTAVIANSSGAVVRTLHLGARAAGDSTVSWDGKNDAGDQLSSGQYVLSVSGTRNDGTSVTASASISATITGVTYANGTAQLVVAGQQISLSDITQITTPTAGN